MESLGQSKVFRSSLIIFVLLAASALFVVRGPWRALRTRGGDFSAPYVEGIRFGLKLNPYSSDDFLSVWHFAGAPSSAAVDSSMEHPVYPPTTLVVMLPFSLMNWRNALASYVFLCSILYGTLLCLLARLVDQRWNSWKRAGFLAFGLALAPVHTAIGMGSLSMLAFVLCMYSLLFAHAGIDVLAGILLALALCIKPTLGVPILIFLLFSRRYKAFAAFFATASGITAIAMLRMSQITPLWRADYRANIAFTFGSEGVATFASASPVRFDLVNLQVPFFTLLQDIMYANLLSWFVTCILTVVWIVLFVQHRKLQGRWAASGAITLLGLLPIYQRNYNTGFVVIALLWAFQNLKSLLAKWIIGVGTIFLLPGEALIRHFGERLARPLTQSMFWNAAVMSQATWGILTIALLLLAAMATQPELDVNGTTNGGNRIAAAFGVLQGTGRKVEV